MPPCYSQQIKKIICEMSTFCSFLCARARSWREFAKCRFTHFLSFFSVYVDAYPTLSIQSCPGYLYLGVMNEFTMNIAASRTEISICQGIMRMLPLVLA